MANQLDYLLRNSYKAEMIKAVKTQPRLFTELAKLAVSETYDYSWKAAWLLWSCMQPNDPRLKKYLHIMVDQLPTRGDSHQREFLMILQRMEMDEAVEGKLIDHCINIWQQRSKTPSLRYNALKLLLKIAGKYPELTREIALLTEAEYLEGLSATARKSIQSLIANAAV